MSANTYNTLYLCVMRGIENASGSPGSGCNLGRETGSAPDLHNSATSDSQLVARPEIHVFNYATHSVPSRTPTHSQQFANYLRSNILPLYS